MITKLALYDFIDSLITGNPRSALNKAVSFRNLRSSVDEAEKVIRVECFGGQHCMTTEDVRKELNVQFTIQCWVLPESDYSYEESAIDDAVDISFDMSREIFEAMASDTSLGGRVCDSYADEFETGEASLGATRRGVTYLDGRINQAS